MKTIEAKDMTDEHWELYAQLEEELHKKYYPESANKKFSPEDLKKGRLYDLETLNDDYLNFYLFTENEKATGWLGTRLVNKDAEFMFDALYDDIPDSVMTIVFDIVKKFIAERGKTEIHTYSKNKRTTASFEKSGGKILDKKIFTRLNRNEIDKDKLKKIADSVSEKINYILKLYDTIPEELFDRYLPVYNDARFDMNQNNPNKADFVKRSKEDLIKKLKWDKGPKDKMYVYVLFDNENIAAFSSLFVREENKKMIDHAGGLTTVSRNYRGQNLARYLKAKLYLKMLEEYPDFEFIRTDTYPWNTYMYRINEEMGFKPYEEYCEIKFIF